MTSLKAPEQTGLSALFLDLNSYFASVEQNENPALRGKPVAVVPMMTDATCAIAASYEAKSYGIRTGTKIYDAKRMCPHLICVLARHDIYVQYHHRVLAAADKHIPKKKTWSIDEFHCELIGREKIRDNAIDIAHRIKRQIWADIGPNINCSIGIAPNTFLAKVASDMQKPDGLVVIEPHDLPGKLLDLELQDLPGINVRMEERLYKGGVRSVEDLWNISPKRARSVWGSVSGERFWYWLHGYDFPSAETNACMVGHSRVLDPDLRTPEKARLMARRLLYKATMRLRTKEFCASALSLGVRFMDGHRWEAEIRFPAASDPFTFLLHFEDMWAAMCLSTFGSLPGRVPQKTVCKKVSVILSGLQRHDLVTGDLFETEVAEVKTVMAKRENLTAALSHLRKKYKHDAVHLGIVPKTLSGHVGTKIAFNRVPEMEEFEE